MKAGRFDVAAVVGVCDEVEIVGRCLDHIERQGVEAIVVVDMMSRDGTRELLRGWRDSGRIALVERNADGDADSDYLAAGVEHARALWDPTWIMLQDADEFYVSACGDLRRALASQPQSVLSISRFNACLCSNLLAAFAAPGPLAVETIAVWAELRRLSRQGMADDPTVRWSAGQPAPKIVAKAELIASVSAGGHGIVDSDRNAVPAAPTADLLIVHVPFLSFARFARKMARAKHLIDSDLSYFKGKTGWHWRRWVEILDAGTLQAEYDRQYLGEAEIAAEVERGAVKRADALLMERAAASGHP